MLAWLFAQALAGGFIVIILALTPNLFDDNNDNDNDDEDDDDDDNNDDDDAFVFPLPPPPSLQKQCSLSTRE